MSNPSIATGIYDAFAAGDMASVLGAMSANMVWKLADGKAVTFQQYTDTMQFARASGG